ncbi:neuronal acetylcholine receptor subunit alpha-10-like isoform X2 [Eriocheir sinensis]|uniref:neuronal acetylcholine receptor subunit alpha-10-like isoform X2 n=1 Tax=Eriocheir sinensis TaxID=95602 RepID=UPI0021CA6143|nr:neuronal acetylcholine receptor subunit alpha-10-like isoform X2 [Eriocheir sinensis]
MTPAGLLLAAALLTSSLEVRADEAEYRLTRYLMSNYDKSVRPSLKATMPLNITFGLALTQIIDVDERNQILTTNCWLNQMWLDYSLQWNASDFGNIQVIRLPAEKLWKPDIILYNNADSQYNNAILSTNIIVTADGNVTWLSSAIFRSSCSINVEFFPFDEQKCVMKFASWTYDGFQVNLVIQTEEGDLSNYVTNGEWDMMDMVVERNVVYYSCCEAPYPDITYHIILRRRPLFYVFNLILPCVLITGIALMSFYMPSDSGEKVTLGITTLLSMTVFLMVIGESMPPTSEKLPLIGLYYGVTISLVSFATGLSVVTLNIHHRGMRGREVPALVKRVVFCYLARIMCIRLDIPDPMGGQGHRFPPPGAATTTATTTTTTATGAPRGPGGEFASHGDLRDRLLEDETKCENGGVPGTSQENLRRRTSIKRMTSGLHSASCPASHPCLDHFERHFLRVLNKVHQTIEKNEIRLAEQDRRDTIRLEWQQVALVVDRFLLWTFIIATISTTFGIMYMSPYTKLFTM